jgi:hypothetical protein
MTHDVTAEIETSTTIFRNSNHPGKNTYTFLSINHGHAATGGPLRRASSIFPY